MQLVVAHFRLLVTQAYVKNLWRKSLVELHANAVTVVNYAQDPNRMSRSFRFPDFI
jgi:hypothetical protein